MLSEDAVPAESAWSVAGRVACLIGLLTVEFGLLRQWLNAASLHDRGAILTLLAERGPGTLRFVLVRFAVAFAMVSLVFADVRPAAAVSRVRTALGRQRLDWRLLLAHVAFTALFSALSAFLFNNARLSMPVDILIVSAWLTTGLTAAGLLVLAFAPGEIWLELLGSMRHVAGFAFVVSVGGLAFSELAQALWQPLSRGTMAVAFTMLHPLLPDLMSDPASFILGTPAFQVEISADCSGYEGLGLMLIFTTAWLWFHRADWRFPHALILIPGGMAAMWLVNCIRVAALVLIGAGGAPEIAVGGFHTQAGWLGLTTVALGICLLARRVPWLLKERVHVFDVRSDVANPVAAYLIPFMAILAASMVAQLALKDFEWLYPIRVVAALAALWYFRDRYRALNWRVGWESIGLGVLVFIIWIGLEPLVNPGAQAGIPLALKQSPAGASLTWLFFRVFGAVVTVPLAEELAFRGFLMRHFDSHEFESVKWQSVSWIAILLSSVAFGALHGVRWLPAMMAGGLYAAAVIRRGSIGDAVVAHAVTNALIAGVVLLGGFWQFW